ncbi:hypothetical protein D3C72_1048750 [compost metagenome]
MEIRRCGGVDQGLRLVGGDPDLPVDNVDGVGREGLLRAAPQRAKGGLPERSYALDEIGVLSTPAWQIFIAEGRDLLLELAHCLGRSEENQLAPIFRCGAGLPGFQQGQAGLVELLGIDGFACSPS